MYITETKSIGIIILKNCHFCQPIFGRNWVEVAVILVTSMNMDENLVQVVLYKKNFNKAIENSRGITNDYHVFETHP